ncbi:hypothetical protein [uncultured Roseobacter sp.]|uniref:hypothetical protein n=1 Tax=uncultured Roseobacter sp. TaxID=114847 RepID=UPI00263977FF|nr:hypothetical protein [uncultured Roseobacter sp.]
MTDGYHRFDLIWCDRVVSVAYQAHWLNSNHWHIELRCAERLPVTGTGYRSHFVPCAEDAHEADVRELVESWLNAAAETDAWQTHLEASRQPDLFD